MNTTLDSYHHPGAAFSQSHRERRHSQQPIADERRLLGDYREDKNGVPIENPARRLKPPNHGVKPTNTLSSNARSSQPILAQGPPRIPNLGSPTPTTRTDSFKRNLFNSDAEQNSSPRKRPRDGTTSQSKFNEVIELDDSGDEPLPNGSKPTGLNEHFGKKFGNGLSVAPWNAGVPEFREVDQTVASRPMKSRKVAPSETDFEERFMDGAKRERRKRTLGSYLRRELNPSLAPAVMKSVEVLASGADQGKRSPEKEGKRNSVQDQTLGRDSSAHESPDELQGEITIRKSISRSPRSANLKGSDVSPKRRSMSPSHIQPSNFTKPQSEPRAKKLKKPIKKTPEKGSKREFNLKLARLGTFRFDETTHPEGGRLTIDGSRLFFSLRKEEPDSQKHKVPVQGIIKAFYGSDPSTKVRLRLRGTPNVGPGSTSLDLEFSSVKETSDFILSLERHGDASAIKVDERKGDWMDNAFNANSVPSTTSTRQNTGSKRSSPENKKVEKDGPAKPETRKRAKLNESLQDETDDPQQRVLTQAGDRSRPQPDIVNVDDHTGESQPGAFGDGVKTQQSSGRDLLSVSRGRIGSISGFFSPRETRSKSRKEEVSATSRDEKQVSPVKLDEPIPKWSRPLVYPRVGKRKAEVEAHDLERLRDHEFLNDNLVGFFLRFLEHHLEVTNPELAKRTYIFNSYFFASLTNTPRGSRGINYQGVSKWTRLVDIFNRDYVVVPINENAHWYVAIICNLPELRPMGDESQGPTAQKRETDIPAMEPSGELTKATGSYGNPESDGSDKKDDSKKETPPSDGDEHHARNDLALLTLSDKNEEAPPTRDTGSEKDNWPEEDENPISPAIKHTFISKPETRGDKLKSLQNPPTSSPKVTKATTTQSKKQSRKSAGPPPRTYDTKQPIIISFDSLGFPRSPTITILRDYLEEEAKSKRSMKIDSRADIRGMNAKCIPEQPNYSDCGLYLLAYLEKFAQDPDEFIRKILQKQMDKQNDWPKMESRVLRKRLRDFLIDLHDEQESQNKKKDVANKNAVDAQPLHILLKPSDKSSKDSPTTRESPMAVKNAQLEAFRKPSSSPTTKAVSPSKKTSSPLEETQKPPVEEIPGTPTELSLPVKPEDGHEASEPEVPGTPDAYFSIKSHTPPSHIKLVDGTPSPTRRSPRNKRAKGKKSPKQPSKSNEANQSDGRDVMDEIKDLLNSKY